MINASTFRNNFLPIMRMAKVSPGMYTDIVYRGHLYRVTIDDLGQDVKQKKRPPKRALIEDLESSKCPTCKKIVFNGLCMNSLCPTNLARL